MLSVDPNLRLDIWRKPAELRRFVRDLFREASIVKLAEDELEFCTGESSPSRALLRLHRWGVALPVITLGARGALLSWHGQEYEVPTPEAKVVDTTGAGDGFVAGLLYALTRNFSDRTELEAAAPEDVMDAVRLGCRVGARVVTRMGAVSALPTAREVGLSRKKG